MNKPWHDLENEMLRLQAIYRLARKQKEQLSAEERNEYTHDLQTSLTRISLLWSRAMVECENSTKADHFD